MRVLAGAFAATVLLVVLAAPASAHAELVSTQPASRAVLPSSPSVISVRFDDGVTVRPDALQLRDAAGARIDHGDVRVIDRGRTIEATVPRLHPGGYVVTWRVVSDDGHTIHGGVTWRIGATSKAVAPSVLERALDAEGANPLVDGLAAAFRTALYLGLVVLVGGLLFLVLAWEDGAEDRRLRMVLRTAVVVSFVSTVAGMGLQAADEAGRSLSSAFRPSTVVDSLDSAPGRAAVVRLLLLLALGVLARGVTVQRVCSRGWRLATLAASAGSMLTLTLAGHARTGRWVVLAMPLDLVHLLAGAIWLGGLAVLVSTVLPRADEGAIEVVLQRFSRVAAVAVTVVVTTGTVQGVRQLAGWSGLRTTDYGRFLVIKVVLVAVVVVIAARTRSLVRATPAGPGRHAAADEDVEPGELRRALKRSVAAEAVLAVVVLAVTSLLVAADPSRAVAASGFDASKVVDGTVIEVTGNPARTGPVDVHIYVSDPSIGLTGKLGAAAEMAPASRPHATIVLPLLPEGRAHWSAYAVEIPVAGTWQLRVTITLRPGVVRTATFPVAIR